MIYETPCYAHTDFSITLKPEDPMALFLNVSVYSGGGFDISRPAGEARVPIAAEPQCDKSIIVYLKTDGMFLIDEPLNDDFHTSTSINDAVRLAWTNVPAAFSGSLADLDIYAVREEV